MATKRQLQSRWTEEPGLSILKRLGTPEINLAPGDVIRVSDIMHLVKQLPFSDEVSGARDLRGAPLHGGLRDLDFSGWDFSYADIGMNLINCRLSTAKFDRARIRGILTDNLCDASCQHADMSGAYVIQSRAHGCRFDDAQLRNVRFNDSDLRGSSFRGAKAHWASFLRCDVRGCDFRGADLQDVFFNEVILDATTDMRGASLINLHYQEQLDIEGQVAFGATDWRLATYDDTTKYLEDQRISEIEDHKDFIRRALEVVRLHKGPVADAIRNRLKLEKVLPDHLTHIEWCCEFVKNSTPDEREFADDVLDLRI